MITKDIIVNTAGGIHVGIAVSIKSVIQNREERVFIKYNSKIVNCKNILKVVSLNIIYGQKITLMIDGMYEGELLEKIEKIINNKN